MYLKAAQLAEAMQTAVTPDQPSSRNDSPDAEMGISHGMRTMAKHLCNIGWWHDAYVSPSTYMCPGLLSKGDESVFELVYHCRSIVSSSHLSMKV